MRAPRSALGFVCLLAAGAAASPAAAAARATVPRWSRKPRRRQSRPAPPKSAFPAPEGRSLKKSSNEADAVPPTEGHAGGRSLLPGRRTAIRSWSPKKAADRARSARRSPTPKSAIYYAEVPKVKPAAEAKPGRRRLPRRRRQALEEPAVGPFPARIETLATKPPSRARRRRKTRTWRASSTRPRSNLPAAGEYRPAVLIKEKGGVGEKVLPSINVGEFAKIPRAGDKPP